MGRDVLVLLCVNSTDTRAARGVDTSPCWLSITSIANGALVCLVFKLLTLSAPRVFISYDDSLIFNAVFARGSILMNDCCDA